MDTGYYIKVNKCHQRRGVAAFEERQLFCFHHNDFQPCNLFIKLNDARS